MTWTFVSTLYLVIAAGAIVMTLREHALGGIRATGWTLLGLLSCLAWPLMLVAVALAGPRARNGG